MAGPEKGFERLGPPRRGDWRSLFREKPQSVDDYIARCANRRTPGRAAFLLQPLGAVAARFAETLARMAEYAGAYFGLEARLLDPIPMPGDAHVFPRDQHRSSAVLAHLADRAPAGALVYLGVTDQDLFAPGKKFVFGEGSLESRTGICSLARLEGSDRRALKLMTHEAGHILSIAHCTAWRCVMQGSNTLDESDGHPLHLCPDDLRKLVWNTGVDPASRYRALAAMYTRWNWVDDARWTAERASQKRVVLDQEAER
jgi:archaemetzincin